MRELVRRSSWLLVLGHSSLGSLWVGVSVEYCSTHAPCFTSNNALMRKTLLAVAACIFCAGTALAAPTIESAEDQSFDQHENIQQARDITITDDATSPQITASGDIRIKIPESFPIIWDHRVTTVNLSGTAVTAGRFANGTAPVMYEDSDKTAVIDVSENFAAGESVLVAGLVFEGFYWADANAKLQLILQKDAAAVATDAKSIQVWTSSNEDSYEPDPPGDISLTQVDSTVKITWTDPPDMDASQIQILRGVAPLPVAGTSYAEEGRGVESFTDTDLEIGDTVSYILRASDGRNISANSEEISITLVEEPADPEPVACTTDYTPVCGSDAVTYSNACNAEAAGITTYTDGECVTEDPTPTEPTAEELTAEEAGITVTQLESAVTKYSDLSIEHWSAGFLARLNADGVLDGYPNGTIQPDTTINRAELAKIATNSFNLTTGSESFTDVPNDAWFASFVGALEQADAAWTTAPEFHPEAAVMRGEATWTILTAAGVDLPAISTKPFSDVSTSHPYAAAIAWAKDNEIIHGYDSGIFGINDTLTRAQVAKIIVLLQAKLAVTSAGNTLTVAISANTTQAKTFPKGAANVAVAAYDFTAGSEDVTISKLEIQRAGVGNASDWEEFYLYEAAERLTSGKTISSTNQTIAFNNLAVAVASGATRTLTLRGNVSTTALGGEHYFEIPSASSIVSTAENINGVFPLRST